jgi:hypothetical protein
VKHGGILTQAEAFGLIGHHLELHDAVQILLLALYRPVAGSREGGEARKAALELTDRDRLPIDNGHGLLVLLILSGDLDPTLVHLLARGFLRGAGQSGHAHDERGEDLAYSRNRHVMKSCEKIDDIRPGLTDTKP